MHVVSSEQQRSPDTNQKRKTAMNNSPKPLAEVCKEIGARIEDYTGSTSGPHGTPYQHSQYAGGKVVTVIYPLPNDFDRTFGPLGVSDARIVGVACGPIVYMEMLTPTPQPEQEQQEAAAPEVAQ